MKNILNIYKNTYFISSLLSIFGFVHLYIYFLFQPDDTFIYLVYVKNFIQGNGLSFNGEYVEGFSSVLWVYLNALFSWIPLDYLYISKILGGFSYFLTAFLLAKIVSKLLDLHILNTRIVVSLIVFFSFPPLAIWAMSGLETLFFTFFLLLSIYYYFYIRIIMKEATRENYILSALLFGLLATIRPEAFALVGIVLLFEVYLLAKSRKLYVNFYLDFLSTYIFIILLLLTWRYTLYGEFLPTTVLAKTGNLDAQIAAGLDYLKRFLLEWWPLVLAYSFYTLMLFFRTKSKPIFEWNVISLITISGYTMFIIATGGDWMLSYRFFVPIIPLILSVVFLGFVQSNKAFSYIVPIFLLFFFTYNNYYLIPTVERQVMSDKGDIYLGQYLKSLNISKEKYIAIFDAGAIPYYSELKSIDMIGLNNRHISHKPGGFMSKYDNDYVLSKKPEYIQMRAQNIKGYIMPELFFIGTSRLFYREEFQKNYIFDEKAPIAHFFKRREKALESTFLDTFYDYSIDEVEFLENRLKFKLKKTGDGLWMKPPYPYAAGSIYLNITIKDSNKKLLYENNIPISDNMLKDEIETLELEIKNLDVKNAVISIQPVLMGIKKFSKISQTIVE